MTNQNLTCNLTLTNTLTKDYIKENIRLYVVVAAYNEEGMISKVVDSLRKLTNYIIVVDDGSADKTSAIAAAAGGIVLRHDVNMGQGAAIRTGVTYAVKEKADYIATFDADGQHDVEDLHQMLIALIETEKDIVLGSRFLGRAPGIPIKRIVLLKMGILFTYVFSGVFLTDVHNGLRVFTNAGAQKLDLSFDRMSHASVIIDSIVKEKLRFIEFPVTITYSKYSKMKGQKLMDIIRIGAHIIVTKLKNKVKKNLSHSLTSNTVLSIFQRQQNFWLYGLILMLPYFYLLFTSIYEPAYDEVYQLEAALRLSLGHPYSASWNIPYDMSTPYFTYLSAWPIGYPLFICALLKLGLSMAAAAKFYKFVIVVLTFSIWFHFGVRFLKSKSNTLFFSCFLAVFIIVSARSVNDLLIVAIAGLLSIMMVRFQAKPDAERRRTPFWFFISAGSLLALAVTVKYSALSLVFSGVAWIIYSDQKDFRRLLRNLTLFSLPVIFIGSLIFATNYHHTRNISTLTTNWDYRNFGNIIHVPYLVHLKAVVFDALQLPLVSSKGLALSYMTLSDFLSQVVFYLLLGWLFWGAATQIRRDPATKRFVYWTALLYISIASFLFVTTILFHPDVTKWTPFVEGRYFTPLAPLLIILLFALPLPLCSLLVAPVRKIAMALMLCLFATIMFAYTFRRFSPANLISRETNILMASKDSLIASKQVQNHITFMDQVTFTFAPRDGRFNVFNGIPQFTSNSFFSKRTLVIIFSSYVDYYNLDVRRKRAIDEKFVKFTTAHHFSGTDISSNTRMYWKLYPPGPVGDD